MRVLKLTSCSTACAAAAIRTLTCKAVYERQPIITKDGGTVALDWFHPTDYAKLPTETPVVLVLHGLTGTQMLQHCLKHACPRPQATILCCRGL